MEKLKFTKEIKEKWLEALKSGKYKQGVGMLYKCGEHCCLGVLCEIHPNLSITDHGYGALVNGRDTFGYDIFNEMLGNGYKKLFTTNDDMADGKYTAVIPLIEALETE